METVKHFERPQFVSISYNDNVGQCECEYHYSRQDAEDYVRRDMKREFEKCKERFPNNFMEHVINHSDIHDNLNRSNWFMRIYIDKNGLLTKKWLKDGSLAGNER